MTSRLNLNETKLQMQNFELLKNFHRILSPQRGHLKLQCDSLIQWIAVIIIIERHWFHIPSFILPLVLGNSSRDQNLKRPSFFSDLPILADATGLTMATSALGNRLAFLNTTTCSLKNLLSGSPEDVNEVKEVGTGLPDNVPVLM